MVKRRYNNKIAYTTPAVQQYHASRQLAMEEYKQGEVAYNKDDLNKYLREAEEKIKEPKKEQEEPIKPAGLGNIFTDAFKGFGEMFGSLIPKASNRPARLKLTKKTKAQMTKEKVLMEKSRKSAAAFAHKFTFHHYDIFKKAHGMFAW